MQSVQVVEPAYRVTHHEFLRHTFAAALDDADLADLTRIMRRLSGSIPG